MLWHTEKGGTLAEEVGYGRTTVHWVHGQVEPWEQEPVKAFRRTPPDPRHARRNMVLRSSFDIFMYPNGFCNCYWSNWSCTKDHGCDVRCGGCIYIHLYLRYVYLYIYTHLFAYCTCSCILLMFLDVFKRWAQMHLVPGIAGALQPPNRCAAPEGSGMLSIDAKQRNHHCYGLLGFCWHPDFMVAMLLLNSQCCCWMLLMYVVIPTFCRVCDMSLFFSVIILLYPSSSGAYINLHQSLSFLT